MPEGPLTRVTEDVSDIALDLAKLVENLVDIGAGVPQALGAGAASLTDSAAEQVVKTLPTNTPVVGGVAGLIAEVAKRALELGGWSGERLAEASARINDVVQGNEPQA